MSCRIGLLALCLAALPSLAGCPWLDLIPPGIDQPPLSPLSINATGPAPLTAGQTAELTVTVDDPAAEAPLSFAWAQVEGVGVALQQAGNATATFVAPSLQIDQYLQFVVAVSDARGAVGSAIVEVIVLADPDFGQDPDNPAPDGPMAAAGADRDAYQGDTVELDGSASTGLALSYRWERLSGPVVTLTGATTAVASFTAPGPTQGGENTFTFELTVTDAAGRTATDQVLVTLQPKPRILVETTEGNFTIEAEPGKAPATVGNILSYVDSGFYVGTIFHRVEPPQVIQGGGFLPGLEAKEPTLEPVPLEADNGLLNEAFTVGLARTNDPNSGNNQWYVNLQDNPGFDPAQNPPGFAVWGRVVDGFATVEAIGAVATEPGGTVPVEDVIIEQMTLLPE